MISCTEHSETIINPTQPKVATFSKVSFEQFKQAFDDLLAKYDTNGTLAPGGVEQIYELIQLPTRATSGSAGYDFRSPINCTLDVYKSIIIPTGIRCKMLNTHMLQLYPRSSLGFKYGMELVNTVGIIDTDYYNAENEGHIMIKIRPTITQLHISMGDKFAQGIFLPYGITTDDNAIGIRSGGIGSTGK